MLEKCEGQPGKQVRLGTEAGKMAGRESFS